MEEATKTNASAETASPARVETAEPADAVIARKTRSAQTARALIQKAKRASRRRFPAEDKIRIVLEGIRGEVSVAELCRREGIHATIYYKWLKDFLEAGKAIDRRRNSRVSAGVKREIIEMVRRSPLAKKWTLADLGITRYTEC